MSEIKIDGLLVYHAKMGGDIEGESFNGEAVYFADKPDAAAVYAEHQFYNDVWTYGDKAEAYQSFEEGFLANAPVVFPVRLFIANPVVLDRKLVMKIGRETGVCKSKLSQFADDFEDSNTAEREVVFAWARSKGYDGAVLPKDLMPVCAGGDWDFIVSYVSFEPQQQVRFLSQNEAPCESFGMAIGM